MATSRGFYDVLGVSASSEQEVVDAAYRALMKKYHPDRFRGNASEADRRAKQLNEAYEVLGDPAKRQAYDEGAEWKLSEDDADWREPEATTASQQHHGPSSTSVADAVGRQSLRQGFWILAVLIAGLALALAMMARDREEDDIQALEAAADSVEAAAPSILQPAPPAIVRAPVAEKATTKKDCVGEDCRTISPQGWGGIQAGMTIAAATTASGLSLRNNGHYDTAPTCAEYEVVGGPSNLLLMVEEGAVTSMAVYQDDDAPQFATDRGIKLGDTEATVRQKYTKLTEEPDIYSEPPDKKLFYTDSKRERGIKFSINGGKVTRMDFGSGSIGYVEGCL